MNEIEKVLMHALFTHLHHNIDQAVDFKAIEELNQHVANKWPGALLVGPGDDAANWLPKNLLPNLPRPLEIRSYW